MTSKELRIPRNWLSVASLNKPPKTGRIVSPREPRSKTFPGREESEVKSEVDLTKSTEDGATGSAAAVRGACILGSER